MHDDPQFAPRTLDDGPDSFGETGAPSSRLVAGDVVDRYVVEALLGEGGVASVYRLRHRALESKHALKVLHTLGSDVTERLLAEGRVQVRLRHPNLVQVQDALEARGAPALLMELVEGQTLAQRLVADPPGPAEAERIFRAIVQGVAEAHGQGIVHRDLKPANVLLADGGQTPKVSDFGIAKLLAGNDGLMTTATGRFLGTPAYMAPEQIKDPKGVDARADVFALGVILYELVCGARPFVGEDVLSLLNAVSQSQYERPEVRTPGLPPRLVCVIDGCLKTDPAQRLPSCAAILDLLDAEAPAAVPPAPRPRRLPLLAAALVAALVGGATAWVAKPPAVPPETALVAEAWKRAERRPAEALALLRHAAATATDPTSVLDAGAVHRLVRSGGAVRVIPAGDQVVGIDTHAGTGQLAAGLLEGDVAVFNVADGSELMRRPGGVGRLVKFVRFDSLGERLTLRAWRGAGRGGGPSAARVLQLSGGEVRHTYSHGESTFGVALSEDDRFAATSGGLHDIRSVSLWNAKTGAPIGRRELGGVVRFAALQLSPDAQQLLVGQRADDGRTEVHLLSTQDLRSERVLELPVPGIPDFLRIVDDGRYLLFGTEVYLGLLDLKDGETRTLRVDLRRVLSVSPRGDRLVHRSGMDLVLRTLPDLELLGTLDTEGSPVEKVSFTADGAFVAAGAYSSDVFVFEADTGRRVRRLPGHESLVLGAEFFDGEEPLLATASRDGTVRLWPRAVPGALATHRVDHGADVAGVALLPARDRHAVLDDDGLSLGGPGTGFVWDDARGAVRCLSTSKDGRRLLVSGAGEDNAAIWALDGPEPKRLGVLKGRRQHHCTLSEDGSVAVRINVDGKISTLNVETGEALRTEQGPADVRRLLLTADGRLAYGGTSDGLLFAFDPRTPEVVETWIEAEEGWSSVQAAPDGQRFVAGQWDGGVVLFRRGGEPIAELVDHTDGVLQATFSDDGTSIATGSWDRTARLWDGATGQLRHVLAHPDGDVTSVAFSDDGAVLWTGCKDRLVRAWDVASGRLLAVHDGHTGPVRAVQALADGGARSVGSGRTLAVWPRPPAAGEDPGLAAGALTNLRVCAGTDRVVPVVPFPPAETTVAPPEACR